MSDAAQLLDIGGKPVRVSNRDKLYWPEEGITKGELIDYYRTIAPVILPHLRDRPMSLNRTPDGASGKSFFQKEAQKIAPPWAQLTAIFGETERRTINYLLCQDEAALVFIANLGCIELNPWASRVQTIAQPDFLTLDLDPQDLPFDRVVETAQEVRRLLEGAGVDSLCKTSGKRGLHICVPLGARYDYGLVKQFAEVLARLANARLPDTTSVERMPAQRRGKVYLDYIQNGPAKTIASAYSARPWPGATVSTPLRWREVRRGLRPQKFTIQTMSKRIDNVGDLWAPMNGPGIDLAKCLEKLAG
jgi:bifunctional non-homologous end joining protein LigD